MASALRAAAEELEASRLGLGRQSLSRTRRPFGASLNRRSPTSNQTHTWRASRSASIVRDSPGGSASRRFIRQQTLAPLPVLARSTRASSNIASDQWRAVASDQWRAGQGSGSSVIEPDQGYHEAMNSLQEMGFSRERIAKAERQLPIGVPRNFENLLQTLFETGSGTPPSSRPSTASHRQAIEQNPSVAEELVRMGFAADLVHTVLSELGDVSAEQALEVLLSRAVVGNSTMEDASSINRSAVPEGENADQMVGMAPDVLFLSKEAGIIDALFDRIVIDHAGISSNTVWRLLLLTDEALRQNLITLEQRAELHGELEKGDISLVHDFLAIVGVRNAPGIPLEDGASPWECCICFSQQTECGWQCLKNHQFCHDCMRHHIEATAFPTCPHVGCGFDLEEADLIAVGSTQTRLEAFRQGLLRNAVDSLGGACSSSVEPETVIRCQRSSCGNAIVVPVGAARFCYSCPCGSAPFCSNCRQAYHYHASCDQVQKLHRDWLAWVSGGREQYFDVETTLANFDKKIRVYRATKESYDSQVTALRAGLLRHQQLEQDEKWKARHCRLCPSCSRPIEKTDGCNSMICGQNFHGGNEQQGCGAKFDWNSARPYVMTGDLDSSNRAALQALPAAPRAPFLKEKLTRRGFGVSHPFTSCSVCGCNGIEGLQFRCIHCESFHVCCKCEVGLAESHNPEHVFEILYESDFDWSKVSLPHGMPVRIVRRGNEPPTCSEPALDDSLEGLTGTLERFSPFIRGSVAHRMAIARGAEVCGAYDVRLAVGTGFQNASVQAEFVEPLIASRSDAQQLIDGTFKIAQ